MAKKPKIRFSGYYPEAVILAIKDLAEKEGLSENEAAIQLLEAGIAATKRAAFDMPTALKLPVGKIKQDGSIVGIPPPGLKGVDLAIWKAEQKAKK